MEQALERAVDFYRQGNFEQAEVALNELRKSGGETPDALHLLALIKLKSGHPATAVEHLNKSLEDRSDSSELLALLASNHTTE
jgi:Tfp pilus assembly protein PilF